MPFLSPRTSATASFVFSSPLTMDLGLKSASSPGLIMHPIFTSARSLPGTGGALVSRTDVALPSQSSQASGLASAATGGLVAHFARSGMSGQWDVKGY